jgi:ComF family protein
MYQTLIKPAVADIKKFVLDTLFPISCLSCGAEGAFICADCKSAIRPLEHQRCIVCQKPTPFGFTHSGCLTPFGADGLICFYNYHDEKVAKLIIGGKYHFLPGVYEILGAMIAQKLTEQYHNILISNNIYTLCPVPLHSSRHRWRGFNQAEILCKAIGKELGFATASVLVRCKYTRTQKDLKKDQRQKNVADAFKLRPKMDICGKNFILVDDVTTTGATLKQAAMVLKRNGAAKVFCLAVARD